jgi:hypothetical protein
VGGLKNEGIMPVTEETIFDHVVDVVIDVDGNDRPHAVVTATLESPDGSRIRLPMKLKAALALHAAISSKFKFLVSNSAPESAVA